MIQSKLENKAKCLSMADYLKKKKIFVKPSLHARSRLTSIFLSPAYFFPNGLQPQVSRENTILTVLAKTSVRSLVCGFLSETCKAQLGNLSDSILLKALLG